MIMPVHRVSVMSSSSSRPQLTVPSPTPFCPSSSSSNKRKLRGTLTPAADAQHRKKNYNQTNSTFYRICTGWTIFQSMWIIRCNMGSLNYACHTDRVKSRVGLLQTIIRVAINQSCSTKLLWLQGVLQVSDWLLTNKTNLMPRSSIGAARSIGIVFNISEKSSNLSTEVYFIKDHWEGS